MNYQEVMAYLEKTWRFGSRLGLERVRELMRRLGDPQKQLRFIHVAGTNGKGSTVTYIASILAASGKKVGIYTSPFINRFGDRVRVLDGAEDLERRLTDDSVGEISEEDVARIFTLVSEAADEMVRDSEEHPTEFELITAMALLYFADQACDVVVLEVGLGGRLDSTNVIDAADICVITALGYDHMDRLGNTMLEIAGEKAGIIKEGTKAVLLYKPELASKHQADADAIRTVVTERCEALGVPLIEVGDEGIVRMDHDFHGQVFRLSGYARPLQTSLLGSYQPENASLAIRAVEQYDPTLAASEAVYRGIAKALWPARVELIQEHPLFLVDGAHNPQAAWKLRETMERLAQGREIVMLTGVLADKDAVPMLDELLGSEDYIVTDIVVTEPHFFRKKDASVYLADIEAYYDGHPAAKRPVIQANSDLEAALATALELARDEKRILLAWGSLYLASDLKHAYAKITNTDQISGDTTYR